MSFHIERSSEARFCLVCLARAVRRSLSRGVRPVPKEGNTFDEAGGVDALSPVLPALTEPTLGDAGARCRGHASWCALLRRNRRARRNADSCNAGWRQRYGTSFNGEIAMNVGSGRWLADVAAPPRLHGPGLQRELRSRKQRTPRTERGAAGSTCRPSRYGADFWREGTASLFRGASTACTFRQKNRRAQRRAHGCSSGGWAGTPCEAAEKRVEA